MKEKENAKQILDNYTFQELDTTFKGLKTFKRVYGLAKIFGYNNPDLNETFKKMDEENKKYKRMKEVLYKFLFCQIKRDKILWSKFSST